MQQKTAEFDARAADNRWWVGGLGNCQCLSGADTEQSGCLSGDAEMQAREAGEARAAEVGWVEQNRIIHRLSKSVKE